MKGTHCDGKGGWTRVAYLNMTKSDATCPPGLSLQQHDNIDHGVCGRPNVSSAGCSSSNFSTLGINYYKVCGQVRGYQYNSPDAFQHFSAGIKNYYVDGVSITHGQYPRTHIWTYAAGLKEDRRDAHACPCNYGYNGGIYIAPSFVGNHYYCESAVNPGTGQEQVLYGNDPLWDGKNCDSREAYCCSNSKMPWFYRVFDDITHNDIELRVCTDSGIPDEDIPLDIIEIYIH